MATDLEPRMVVIVVVHYLGETPVSEQPVGVKQGIILIRIPTPEVLARVSPVLKPRNRIAEFPHGQSHLVDVFVELGGRVVVLRVEDRRPSAPQFCRFSLESPPEPPSGRDHPVHPSRDYASGVRRPGRRF